MWSLAGRPAAGNASSALPAGLICAITLPEWTRTHRYRKVIRGSTSAYTTAYFADYAIAPKSVAIPISHEMPLDRASLLACAVTTGVGAAVNTAQVRPGTTVAVFGCGGVGVNVIQGAALCGARRIIGVDIVEDKLEYGRGFGLTDVVNAAEQDPVEASRS